MEHTLRELAAGGAVFGTTVVRFKWLFETIAERCGAPPARRASAVQRDLLVEAAVRSTDLRELRASAARPGFARAAARLIADLERSMVEPGAFARALEQWAARGPRARYAREVASIYSAYRDRLDAAGLVDEDLFAWRAVDALRDRPDDFGATPVFVYGFDDFTPIELDALEALAARVGVDVTVSLPYERGRAAFRAVAPLFERLRALADRHMEQPAISDWYAGESRAALHHLERSLYEGTGEPRDPGEAVKLLSAGGERAEVELVAANALRAAARRHVRRRHRRGVSRPAALRLARRAGVRRLRRAVLDRPLRAASATRRSAAGCSRCCAAPRREGTADDLLAYLRTPGYLDHPRIADRLEAQARQAGAATAAQARKLWEERLWPLRGDRPAARGARRGAPGRAGRPARRALRPAYAREAPHFATEELDDPRALRAGQQALRGPACARARRSPPRRSTHARVRERLEPVEVQLGEDARPDRVQIATPEAIRARRFDAVFVCGLQEGEFPRPRDVRAVPLRRRQARDRSR